MWVLSSFCFVVEGGHGLNSSLGILWQACPGGARILRVFGDSPCPALPVQIEGFPVVEIGPYCFAQNQRSQPADARFWSVDGRGPAAYPHPIAGDFVQGVTLPAGVRALHNAAFYNCRKLEWLCAGSALESVGSDLFTNCRALDRFILDAAPDAPTGLKKLVAAVSADIGAVSALFGRRPGGTDALVSVATIASLVLRENVVALTVLWLLNIGEYLQDLTLRRSRRAISELLSGTETRTWLRHEDGTEVEVDIDDVAVGDDVVVHDHVVLPVDGTVVAGEAVVDQSAITGETLPVAVAEGRWLHAGSVVLRGRVVVRAEAVGRDTAIG